MIESGWWITNDFARWVGDGRGDGRCGTRVEREFWQKKERNYETYSVAIIAEG